MGKPRLIILIRHAQSEGNKNRDIHQTIPDHRVKLTQDGWQQAYEAGRRLRALLRADDTLHFFTSPYRRTRETTEGILATLTSDEPEPSPFKRNNIKVYEEPRLREQDFGNFQPCSAEMERMWQERADYGHFFYRIPNGESAADAYDRISGFNESLWRQFSEDDFASVCVLVTHGLMSRVFLMKWYHFSVEYFEDLRNVNHCEFLIMRKEESGKYLLENKLRTWSELRRERALQLLKEKGADGKDQEDSKDGTAAKENGNSKELSKLDCAPASTPGTSASVVLSPPVEKRRRWGGCPNGCDHDKGFKIRQTLADLVQSDNITSNPGVDAPGTGKGATNSGAISSASSATTVVHHHKHNHSTAEAVGSTHGVADPSFNGTANSHTIASRRPAAKRLQSLQNGKSDETNDGLSPEILTAGPQIDVTKAREEIVSSPDGTPSFISVEDRLRGHIKSPNGLPPSPQSANRLHVGRDFGGTYSGHSSVVASDADSSEDEQHRRQQQQRLKEPAAPPPANTANTPNANKGDKSTTNGNTLSPPSILPHHFHSHHLSQRDRDRDQSRMGRGTRANRLGDHPHSSDGEHEADGEHEEDGDGLASGSGSMGSDDDDQQEDGLARTLTDEADSALLDRAEQDDRSIQGSVY
ncbi:histidine phosphatase superfamily [Apodospora peruviana]|uniref:Histidine phosphatase superfamily n=1 Tax=Apodospora peruviana TaxID=516989 RepID=A0AAE0HY93_9PEZI|nr:histidine phosphatase superfamily [Apodospora peruviana]